MNLHLFQSNSNILPNTSQKLTAMQSEETLN